MLATAVLTVGMGAAIVALVTAMAQAKAAREQSLALQGAEDVVESLLSLPAQEVFFRYNATVVDDPATGASPGDTFTVPGLSTWAGEAAHGRVLFPGDNVTLREDVVDAALGMPRDLTLDDPPDIDVFDHANDYRLLPTLVRVRWRGALGERELALPITLVRREQP